MLNSGDPRTLASLSRLSRLLSDNKRPIVLWIGAGASRWAGFPSWDELAKNIRRRFVTDIHTFDNIAATKALNGQDYPQVFERCKLANEQLYRRFLAEQLESFAPSATYHSLIEKLQSITPLFVLTTNVDLALEQNLVSCTVLERSDLERATDLIQKGQSFIAKLHGSVSATESLVFASSEYEEISTDSAYLAALTSIFEIGTVIFLGYGVRDEYIVDLLHRNADNHRLFGGGPHFIVSSSSTHSEVGFDWIVYSNTTSADHRAALYILDFIKQKRISITSAIKGTSISSCKPTESAIFISDFKTPGTHETAQSVQIGNTSNGGVLTVGLGFMKGELPSSVSRAFHDLLVGLICFDRTYLPIDALAMLINSIGGIAEEIVHSDAVSFVFPEQDAVVVKSNGAQFGSVGLMTLSEPDTQLPRTLDTVLRRMLKSNVGKEIEFATFVATVQKRTKIIGSGVTNGVAQMVRDALVMPHVAELIGLNDSILPSQVPDWLVYPILRLAHLVKTSVICENLGTQAVRIPFGGKHLIEATFGLRSVDEMADSPASYVMSGRFASNLGSWVKTEPTVLRTVLKFRETPEGIILRGEIRDNLKVELGSDFATAINAGLKRNVPSAVLDKARDTMNRAALADGRRAITPAVWADNLTGDSSTDLWRQRSRRELLNIAEKLGTNKNSPCICGSGEKLTNC